MIRNIHNWGYPLLELYEQLLKVARIDKNSLFTQKTEANIQAAPTTADAELTLYMITTYNPANPPLADIIAKYWPILGRSAGTRMITKAKIIYGNRRPRNLKDSLIKAKLPGSTPTISSF